MRDEQPLCQASLDAEGRLSKFLGQQSEMAIDDTWPQTGEMRSALEGYNRIWDT